MKKRISITSLLIASVMLLSACGSVENTENVEESSIETTTAAPETTTTAPETTTTTITTVDPKEEEYKILKSKFEELINGCYYSTQSEYYFNDKYQYGYYEWSTDKTYIHYCVGSGEVSNEKITQLLLDIGAKESTANRIINMNSGESVSLTDGLLKIDVTASGNNIITRGPTLDIFLEIDY